MNGGYCASDVFRNTHSFNMLGNISRILPSFARAKSVTWHVKNNPTRAKIFDGLQAWIFAVISVLRSSLISESKAIRLIISSHVCPRKLGFSKKRAVFLERIIFLQIFFAARRIRKLGNITQGFTWRIFSYVTCLDQSHESENVWWIKM